jgi:hypothetical protein
MADVTVKSVAPVPADSFVKPNIVTVPANQLAQDLFKAGGVLARLQVLFDAGPIVLDGDSHSAFWVYVQNATGWQHLVSLTDSRDVDLGWDGQEITLKIVAAFSYACSVGIGVNVLFPREAKVG